VLEECRAGTFLCDRRPLRKEKTELKMRKQIQIFAAVFLLAAVLLAACAGSTPDSIAGQWKLVSYGPSDAPGQTPAAADVETSIEFDAEGRMGGNVGCNGFGGDYTVDGDTIEFGPIVSTMMFCEGPVGEQEGATLAVFQETAKFMLDGDMLTITSADGNSVIVLERK
jgi:heat shock protein HslJ